MKMTRKKNKKLLFQVMALIIIFFVIIMFAATASVYYGGRNAYLGAKNEMIARDLERVCSSLSDYPSSTFFFEYAKDHSKEINEPMFESETDRVYEFYLQNNLFNVSRDDFYKTMSKAPDDMKLGVARDHYGLYKSVLTQEIGQYVYGELFIVDVSDEYLGLIYMGVTPNGAVISLGSKIDYTDGKHPAIDLIRKNQNDDVVFEIVENVDNVSHAYIGYKPIIIDGKIVAVVGCKYNWEEYHQTLLEDVKKSAGINILAIIFLCVVLLLFLKIIFLNPITMIQRSVRDYNDNKDSDAVIESFGKLKSRNELGVLSDDIASLTVEMDNYIDGIKNLSVEVMEALAHTIDAKDKYTNGHSVRVAKYSKMIAKRMGMSEEDQENIYYMGLLHDIGKIGVPNEIINKTSRLDDAEYEIIKTHPVLGSDILSEIKSMPELALGARWHHERYDGKGYPDKLKGENIPFFARIIAVADSYDAMTSNRSYRNYLPQDVVRGEIEKNLGTQFDPEVGKVMIEIIDEDKDYSLHE